VSPAVSLCRSKSRGGWLEHPSTFYYDVGRCSYHPCAGKPAVETNDAIYLSAKILLPPRVYHLCARHAQVVGRRHWSSWDVRLCGQRIWRWLTTQVMPPECPEPTAHFPAFDEEAAKGLSAEDVRRRWPRRFGPCSACGEGGIAYASFLHYVSGDW